MKSVWLFCAFMLLVIACPVEAANKDWTFLAYMHETDATDPYVASAVNRMEKIGSNAETNIVVQWGNCSTGVVQRFLLQRDLDPNRVTTPPVDDISGADMGSPQCLSEFIRWGIRTYPANHYFIVVRGLSPTKGGWHEDVTRNAFSGSSITWEQVGQILVEASQSIGRKIDIFGADASLGGMIEIADQLAEAVDVFIASQAVEPLWGWPYDRLFEKWSNLPGASAKQVARMLIQEYREAYGGSSEVTLSALDLNQLGLLRGAMKALVSDIRNMSSAETDRIYEAAESTQRFEMLEYADLIDFLRRLQMIAVKGRFRDPNFLRALLLARNAAENTVISNGTTPGFGRANGMSIWWPTERSLFQSYAFRYNLLEFEKSTNWSDALNRLIP